MENHVKFKAMQIMSSISKSFEITVSGTSMNPVLYKGDIITVQPSYNYDIGEILVFKYDDNELLVHRLLNIKNTNYFCKGDNAFRLEKVNREQIIGKVIALKRGAKIVDLPVFTDELIRLSRKIYRIFFYCEYDLEKTRGTDEYTEYKKLLDELVNNLRK